MTKPISIFEKIEDTERKTSHKETVTLLLEEDIFKKDRERKILIKRFGLNGKEKRTLDSIGKEMKITRERVRQIENASLNKVIKYSKNITEIKKFNARVNGTITENKGVISEQKMISLLIPTKDQNENEINSLIFLLRLNENISRNNENNQFRSFWTKRKVIPDTVKAISKKIDDYFKKEKKPQKVGEIASKIGKDSILLENILLIKKNVMQNDKKEWGLATWREINPKSIRDKTYVILTGHKKPLHYHEIAKKIALHPLQKRPVTKQAVHNELIRDERFVLIGRGIYALSEWGYTKGVVADVIEETLKDHGEPLHKKEIIKRVKKKRIVKDTTIVLNLQKNKFKRVARATYTLTD